MYVCMVYTNMCWSSEGVRCYSMHTCLILNETHGKRRDGMENSWELGDGRAAGIETGMGLLPSPASNHWIFISQLRRSSAVLCLS